MSVVSWSTKSGTVGVIPELQYYSYQLEAVDSAGQELFYSFLSGQLPGGMYLTRDGRLQGTPSITDQYQKNEISAFVVRATNPDGAVADRSFAVTVSNVTGPQILLDNTLVGAWFDGTYLDYQFEAANESSTGTIEWKIVDGQLPPGTSLSTTGRLFGFVDIIAANPDLLGFDAVPVDYEIYDPLIKSRDRYYNFTLQVSDGIKFDTLNVRILVVSKSSFTSDNDLTFINNTFISIDTDDKYRPIILNAPDSLPTLVSGSTFAYRFLAFDPEDADISWSIDELAFSGMDDLDLNEDLQVQEFVGNGTSGPYTLNQTPLNAGRITVRLDTVLLTASTDYTVVGDQLTFVNTNTSFTGTISGTTLTVTSTPTGSGIITGAVLNGIGVIAGTTITANLTGTQFSSSSTWTVSANHTPTGSITITIAPSATNNIEVMFVEVNYGFDTLLFDQGAYGLPTGITINPDTGWAIGSLPTPELDVLFTAETRTYEFKVRAYRTLQPGLTSDEVTFSITVKRTLNEEIIWTSPANLGEMDNGAISELYVDAYNTLGKELDYTIVFENYRKTPQGLKFLRSGRFTGRTTFRYFSLDGTSAKLNIVSTTDLEVGMLVQGPGVTSGCKISAIVDSNTIEVRPAIYVSQGTLLTFTNITVTKVVSTTSNSISTAVDGGATTFDQLSSFTVKAEAIDKSISSKKTFTVKVVPYNLAPYENVYLKSLPSIEQRNLLKAITTDETVFPPNLIYRADDPNFGVAKSFKFLFLPGLSPSAAATFVDAIQYNHYNKVINFGTLKTAVAKDPQGVPVYEVVYVDAQDNQAYNTIGPEISTALDVQYGFYFNGTEYKTIYPNSFNNMQTRFENTVGYTNRGALPKWMTSVQENGLVLGLTRAIILAYVKVGSSKLIKYRLQKSLEENSGNFTFIADRYQWDNYLSTFYDPTTGQFEPSRDTTFDKYTNESSGDIVTTTVTQAVTNSDVISIPDSVVVGLGWVVESRDASSEIPANTVVTDVVNDQLYLSNSVNSDINAEIRIIGEAKADYAVSQSFNTIDGSLLTVVRDNLWIDGIYNFLNNEVIIFKTQFGFAGEDYDGWVYSDGTVIPGYLDKISQASTVNLRSGLWRMVFRALPALGFDDDNVGFDSESPDLYYSRFDQGDNSELQLVFVSEVLFNQSVAVRTGKSYPASILTYTTGDFGSVPYFIPTATTVRTAETTFDGGSCCVREKDIQAGRRGIRGGTAFSTNRDKYIKPESKDKYIKFPQNGVFV